MKNLIIDDISKINIDILGRVKSQIVNSNSLYNPIYHPQLICNLKIKNPNVPEILDIRRNTLNSNLQLIDSKLNFIISYLLTEVTQIYILGKLKAQLKFLGIIQSKNTRRIL